jgi:hypothetical protein
MGALLRWVSRRRPWRVAASFLAISLVTAPLDASLSHPALLVVGAALGMVLTFGYPFLIIFGFPKPYATPSRRRIALASCALLLLAVVTAAQPGLEFQMPEWLRFALGLLLGLMLFAPFFIATSVIGDARRTFGLYKLGDCIGTCVCIFSYPLFGVFFIQRVVASVLELLDSKGSPVDGAHIAV